VIFVELIIWLQFLFYEQYEIIVCKNATMLNLRFQMT